MPNNRKWGSLTIKDDFELVHEYWNQANLSFKYSLLFYLRMQTYTNKN